MGKCAVALGREKIGRERKEGRRGKSVGSPKWLGQSDQRREHTSDSVPSWSSRNNLGRD